MPENFNRLSSVSFFCPAYHDEGNLPTLILKVHAFLSEIADKFEIIIIEDGSPDKTGEMADKLAGQYSHVTVIHHKKNMGYGATLREGFLAGKYDYVMYTDGDNQYDIYDFKPYLYLLGDADVLSGYAVEKAVSFYRKIQSLLFNLLVQALFFVKIKDINCSMKIYKKTVLDKMKISSASAFIDAEMIIKAKKLGFRIAQFPVRHFARSSGMASGSKFNVVWGTIKDAIKFRLGLL